MVGLDTRATLDIDATIKGLPVTAEIVMQMFMDICNIQIEDDVYFSFNKITKIRAEDELFRIPNIINSKVSSYGNSPKVGYANIGFNDALKSLERIMELIQEGV